MSLKTYFANNIFFFQTQQISDDSNLFHQLKKQNISYSYFQAHQNYYLFIYSQKLIDINFLYQSIDLIEELDSKKRKIRSFRGYFLYALEIIQNAQDYQILQTNLQPFFWKKVQNIIRQNKKDALLEFLFLDATDNKPPYQGSNPPVQILQDQIQALNNQVDSLTQQVQRLQQKVFHLETLRKNSKYPLSDALKASRDMKITQKGNSKRGLI